MNNVYAIYGKQLKDTWHNKSILLQFVMFPILAIAMSVLLPAGEMSARSISTMYAAMYTGMIPMSCMCSVIAEEREKGTLRALFMANVKGWQYLLGIGSCLVTECVLGITVFAILGRFAGVQLLWFVGSCSAGILVSMLLGAAIGLAAKNQMAASALTAPTSIVLSFVPVLGDFNEKLSNISEYFYTQQIKNLLNGIGVLSPEPRQIIILAANFILFAVLFLVMYRKKGLRS